MVSRAKYSFSAIATKGSRSYQYNYDVVENQILELHNGGSLGFDFRALLISSLCIAEWSLATIEIQNLFGIKGSDFRESEILGSHYLGFFGSCWLEKDAVDIVD